MIRFIPLEAWAYSNVRVVNAWYIRFNDFQFSYNLPDKWIKGFAKSVTLSFSATNPLQIKSKDFKGRIRKLPWDNNLVLKIFRLV